MALNTIQTITVSNGGTYIFSYDPLTNLPDIINIISAGGNVAATITLSLSSTAPIGTTFKVIFDNKHISTASLDSITFFGDNINFTGATTSYFDYWQDSILGLSFKQSPLIWQGAGQDFGQSIDGHAIVTNTLPLSTLRNGTPSNILIVDSSNIWNETPMSGDITISDTGVTSIGTGVITNSEINTSAAIAVTKLAALIPSEVVTTNGSGFIQSSATLSSNLGGLGLNASSSTGFILFSSGTVSIGSISEVIIVDVELTNPPSGVANNKIKIPYTGVVTDIYAIVTETIAGTDSGTIIPKNNAGTNMTLTSPLTFAANSAVDTAIDTSVTANNVVSAGDILSFTTSKPTPGGKIKLSVTITRTS